MYEGFGARQVDTNSQEGRVAFRLFIPDTAKDPGQYQGRRDPHIKGIQVVGTFQSKLDPAQPDWDPGSAPQLVKTPHAKGWMWEYVTDVALPTDYYEYKYYVTFEDPSVEARWCTDPCARYGGRSDRNSAFVVGGSFPDVQPLQGGRKPLRDLVVYELNIDDFTAEYRGSRAPIEAIKEKIDHLRGLGINAILFMPWTAWPTNGYSWGYTPFQYFSVEYRYANSLERPAEKLSLLKGLISACHEAGIQVIMDGVFNHAADSANQLPYTHYYQNRDDCPYTGAFGGTFTGLTDLNYANGCTQELIQDVCFYWIDTFRIDGIRFDNTVNYYVPGTTNGLPGLLTAIRDHTDRDFPLILEHIDLSAAAVTKSTDATSYWDNSLYGATFDGLWNRSVSPQLFMALNANQWLKHPSVLGDKLATTYLTNHDHSHVAWQAGARDNAGSMESYRTNPYVIALLSMPGAPMILNGEEFGEDAWVMEDDQGSGRRVIPRPLRWQLVTDPIGSALSRLYQRLIAIRGDHPALRTDNFYPEWEAWMTKPNQEGYGLDVERQTAVFHRWGNTADGTLERITVVLNFSDQRQTIAVPFSVDGTWVQLNADAPWSIDVAGNWHTLSLDSHWGHIFWKAG
jgi:1,4-alpha-glucan branching enzyme